jgi:hypothetical protein
MANPTSTSENEIACMARRVITHNDEVHQPPPDTPGMYFYKDDMLTLFILNDVYATLNFEAFDFFSNEYAQTMRVDSHIHNRPLCEDLLDFVRLLHLDLLESMDDNMTIIENNVKDGLQEKFNVDDTHPSFNIWVTQSQHIILTKIQSLQSKVSFVRSLSVQQIKASNLPFTLRQRLHLL